LRLGFIESTGMLALIEVLAERLAEYSRVGGARQITGYDR
jgi:hypothetical protein